MKKLVLLSTVLLIASVTTLSAKRLPSVAAKLPATFKQEIVKQIDYPAFASENQVEGEVWMKVAIDDQSNVKIVDLSATNQDLGKYVRKQLTNAKAENVAGSGQVYFLKVTFDLLEK